MTGEPDCSGQLDGYCTAEAGTPIACPGDCFGDADTAVGSALCRRSALALGRIVPRCEPPIVQLSFSFQAGVDMAAQDDFGNLVQSLNNQLGSLYAILARADLMAIAAADLSAAASGPLADRIADLIDADPTNTGLSCVQDALPDLESWLDDQIMRLEDLRTAAMQVVTTASPAP
jgi:hypothetical protein